MFSLHKQLKKMFPNKKIEYGKQFSITAEFKFEGCGVKGTTTSQDSALTRPFRVLMDTRRPVGRINHIFYRDNNSRDCYVLGSLCYTYYAKNKKRLIFFPGLQGRKMLWHSATSNTRMQGDIDHFTVEPDLKTWHYTSIINNKKEAVRLPDNKVFELKRGLHYLFGISISNPDKLEVLREKTMFKFTLPSEHADKCSVYLMEAKENSKDNIVHLADEGFDSNSEFVHFDFILDRRIFRRFRKLPKEVSVVPQGKNVRKDANIPSGDFLVRKHKISVRDFRGDIYVIVSKHKGRLTEEVIISGGGI